MSFRKTLALFSALFLTALALLGGCRTAQKGAARPSIVPASPILFSNRAAQARLNFSLGHNGKSPLTILDVTGCGAAFLDYDGDGQLDIFLVGQPRCALFRNRGDGTFEDVAKKMGIDAEGVFMGVAVGDVDGDGRPDLFISGYGKNVLYLNRPTGFIDATKTAGLTSRSPYDWAVSAVFADFDGDGNLDLAMGHYVTFTPKTLQFCTFESVKGSCPPYYYESQSLTVYRGDGHGKFVDATRKWGFDKGHGANLGLAAVDYDGDGRTDLYVANDGQPADLWRNTGKGFENKGGESGTAYNQDGKEQAGMGADWGDYDGDGRLDLAVTTFQNEPRALYRNLGNGQFQYASNLAGIAAPTLSRLGFGVVFADFDQDGLPDLLFANGHVQDTINQFQPPATYKQKLQCFHNEKGVFREVSEGCGASFSEAIVGRGLAIGDYDNDGRPDALVVNAEGKPLLLHNDSPLRTWLGVRLIGRPGNRDAIGSKVILTTDRKNQIREIQTGRGYLSASDPRALFGLGETPKSARLTVIWHGGKTQQVPIDRFSRYVTIEENPK